MRASILLAVAAVVLAGCASMTPPARMHVLESGKSYWFDYEGTRRGMILVSATDAGGQPVLRSCAEPSPDMAMVLRAKAGAQGNYQGVLASADGAMAQSVEVLGERTQMVMFFREALFRVCEMSLNQNLTPVEIGAIYKDIIGTALRLGADKALENDARALEIESAAKLRELEMTLQSKAELDQAKRQLELQIALASQEDRLRKEQALAAVEVQARQVDERVATQIAELNVLSQQKVDSVVRAATDAAAVAPVGTTTSGTSP